MLTTYPACFYKEKEGYSVIFPDLNGASTCGKDLDEAITMAVDCLAGYIYSSQKDKEDIPAPSPISSISAESIADDLEFGYSEAFVNLVSVDVKEYAKNYSTAS